MDDDEKKMLVEIRNLNVKMMSPYIIPPKVWAAPHDETFQLIMHQQALLDSLLGDEGPGPVLILIKG